MDSYSSEQRTMAGRYMIINSNSMKRIKSVRFEVVTAMLLKIQVL
jgi:hypothetical protein